MEKKPEAMLAARFVWKKKKYKEGRREECIWMHSGFTNPFSVLLFPFAFRKRIQLKRRMALHIFHEVANIYRK